MTDDVAQGLSVPKAERLRGILSRRFNAFRRALRGDPPARVEPMRVQLKPRTSAVKAKPRRYDPVKTSWLASCGEALLAFGLVFRNLQAVWSSPVMAVPKQDSLNDYKAVNEQVEKSSGVMPNQEADMVDLLSARVLVSWTSSKATGRCLGRRRHVRVLRSLLRLTCSPP